MNKSYEVPVHAVEYFFDTILLEYKYALTKLESFGVKINPSSRLIVYKNKLEELVANEESLAPTNDLYLFSHALREIIEIIDITNILEGKINEEEVNIIHELPSGNFLPEDDKNSMARDKQYELWLKSFLLSRGIPAYIKEPDIFFEWEGSEYPIAAKRPKSQERLDTHIRSANSQLKPYTCGGLISISLDFLIRYSHVFPIVDSPMQAAKGMDSRFKEQYEFLMSKGSPLKKRINPKIILGCLITGRQPYFSEVAGALSLESRYELLVVEGEKHESLLRLREKISSFIT